MRNVQKEFFERSLKRQGVTVSVNGVETKALIINEKDIKTSWCYSDIILPYEIKAEIGDIIHVGDKRFFICNKDEQYGIRNLYRCCENVHEVRFDYQNGTIKSAGLVTLTEDKVTSLFDNALLELAKGVAIFNIKHTTETEQIEVGDRFVLMNRAYEVIGCTWGTQNLIKLELEKSTWRVDDDKENGIIVNKREVRLEEEPPTEPEEPTEPINDTIVGDDSVDVGASATYTITNSTGANVTWSVDNANVTITSSDNTSCTIEGVTNGNVTITVTYPTGEVFSKVVTINKVITYDIDAYGELGDWSLQTVESGTPLTFLNAETDTYFLGGNKAIFKSEDKGLTWEKVATPSYSVKTMAIGQVRDGITNEITEEVIHVVVGASRLTGYSNDKGETWNFFTDEVTKVANDVKYIDGYFISVATGKVGISYEGECYNETSFSDTSFVGQKLNYVNGKWVIVGTKGKIAILNDDYEAPMSGRDFTIIDTGVGSISFLKIVYSKQLDLYVLVGTNGTIVTSPDLVTFTTVANGLTGCGGGVISLLDCIYANQMFIAVGTRSTIYTSRDGVNWTQSFPCGESTSISFNCITVDKQGKVFITLSNGTIATNQFITI